MRFNGGTLMTLLDDILDLAKVESGRVQVKKIEFDLGDLVEATVETLVVRATARGWNWSRGLRPAPRCG